MKSNKFAMAGLLALATGVSGCTVDIGPGGDFPGQDTGWPSAARSGRLADAHYAYCRSGDLALKVNLLKSDLTIPLAKEVGIELKLNAQSGFQAMTVTMETQSLVDGVTQVITTLDTPDHQSVIVETKDGAAGNFWHVVGQSWTGGECRFYSEGV